MATHVTAWYTFPKQTYCSLKWLSFHAPAQHILIVLISVYINSIYYYLDQFSSLCQTVQQSNV